MPPIDGGASTPISGNSFGEVHVGVTDSQLEGHQPSVRCGGPADLLGAEGVA